MRFLAIKKTLPTWWRPTAKFGSFYSRRNQSQNQLKAGFYWTQSLFLSQYKKSCIIAAKQSNKSCFVRRRESHGTIPAFLWGREGRDVFCCYYILVIQYYRNKLNLNLNNIYYLVIEKVDCVLVQPEWQGLEEGNVIRHDFFIRKVKSVHNNRVDMVVWEQVI